MANQLNVKQVSAITTPGDYRVDNNLYLRARDKYRNSHGVDKRWITRIQVEGKRKWVSLGPYPKVSLKEARSNLHKLLETAEKNHLTPTEVMIEKREEVERKRKESVTRIDTSFQKIASKFLKEVKLREWKTGAKSEKEWNSRFDRLIYPVIGNKQINQITTNDVLKIVNPIWMSAHESARRSRIASMRMPYTIVPSTLRCIPKHSTCTMPSSSG